MGLVLCLSAVSTIQELAEKLCSSPAGLELLCAGRRILRAVEVPDEQTSTEKVTPFLEALADMAKSALTSQLVRLCTCICCQTGG